MIAVRRDEVVREISGRAAIVAVPTLIASVYGMNFEHMPEIGLRYGHPVVLGAMVLVGAGPHRVPERAGWV